MFNMHWHMFIISTVTTSKFPSLTVIFFVITSAQIWGKSPCFNCAAVWDQGEQWAPHRHMVTWSQPQPRDLKLQHYLQMIVKSSRTFAYPPFQAPVQPWDGPHAAIQSQAAIVNMYIIYNEVLRSTALWVFVCAETLAIANLSMECR